MKDYYKSLKTELGRVRIHDGHYAYVYRVQLEDGTLSNVRTKRLCKTYVSDNQLSRFYLAAVKET